MNSPADNHFVPQPLFCGGAQYHSFPICASFSFGRVRAPMKRRRLAFVGFFAPDPGDERTDSAILFNS
ncbi:MAG: hypothetical protein A3E78_11575 [Alphaproteobacteria bacterium RIFCSPHIGHO2_12_FULL_63_12]|nr:MAG: hypothetical protein A3E78_11575 [Alphaproteobacteria bacterium RIFCSPHIGHO2_12_FULL_63_12]